MLAREGGGAARTELLAATGHALTRLWATAAGATVDDGGGGGGKGLVRRWMTDG